VLAALAIHGWRQQRAKRMEQRAAGKEQIA